MRDWERDWERDSLVLFVEELSLLKTPYTYTLKSKYLRFVQFSCSFCARCEVDKVFHYIFISNLRHKSAMGDLVKVWMCYFCKQVREMNNFWSLLQIWIETFEMHCQNPNLIKTDYHFLPPPPRNSTRKYDPKGLNVCLRPYLKQLTRIEHNFNPTLSSFFRRVSF